MTYVQVLPVSTHADGQQAQVTHAWPDGATNVAFRFDVWGAGGAGDPWTGVASPFNDPALRLQCRILVRYADNRIEEVSGASIWVGRPDGNWGRHSATQPTSQTRFGPGQELPVDVRPGFRVLAGPITFGISVEIT